MSNFVNIVIYEALGQAILLTLGLHKSRYCPERSVFYVNIL